MNGEVGKLGERVKIAFFFFISLLCVCLLSSIIVKPITVFMLFSIPQGLPGFVGPPGQLGITGEKVKLSLFQVSCCCASSLQLFNLLLLELKQCCKNN